MTLTQIQDLLSDALQSDLEHGVKWLNEAAMTLFRKDYPLISEAIQTILAAEEEEELDK